MRISEPAVQAKHTATPWQVVDSGDPTTLYIDDDFGTDGGRDYYLATVRHGDEDALRANADFIVRACNAHQELVTELIKAEKIILTMLNAMSPTQRDKVMRKLESDGVSEDGATRYHERRAAISKAMATE